MGSPVRTLAGPSRGGKWLAGFAALALIGAIFGNDEESPTASRTGVTSASSVATSSGGASTSAEAPTAAATSTSTSPTAESSATSPAPDAATQVADQNTVSDGATQAAATLATLPVKGRAPKTGYSREQFGTAWTDDVTVDGGHNGCDTRNDMLRRDLIEIVLKSDSNGCAVLSGTLHDPYTATSIAFVRGDRDAVHIDHVVALSDAWQKGAQQLTPQQRADFANDPLNLQATAGSANISKGDGDAATWLPPNKSYRCTYVARQVEVKAKYELWVTEAERNAIADLLADCGAVPPAAADPANQAPPTTQAPPTQAPPTQAPPPTAAPPPPPTTQAPPPPPPPAPAPAPDGSGVYYKNCDAARAAGAAPILAGEPGYRPALDRNNDGVACEK